MTNRQFRVRVSAAIGTTVSPPQVRHAIKTGHLTRPDKRGGWMDYTEQHVSEMVEYVHKHSRNFIGAEIDNGPNGTVHGTR